MTIINWKNLLFADVQEEKLDYDINDPRPQPHYEVTFRERVTPSQVYLPVRI